MASNNVRIVIPTKKADQLIDLGTIFDAKNTALGEASPIKEPDYTKLGPALLEAKGKRDQAKALHKQAEALNQEADLILGIDGNQNSKTAGTVLNLITRGRDTLLGKYRGQEEKLGEWGFKVVRNGTTGTTTNP